MKTREKFYILFLFMTIVSCKQGIREFDTSVDLSDKARQYSQLVLDNIFESELHFPSEYRVMDFDGNLLSLRSLMNTSKIVIRLHESYCESCIVDQIQIINSSLQSPQDAVIGLATYSNIREFLIMFDKYKIEFPVYFIPYSDSSQLFSGVDRGNDFPFYFFIDSDLKSQYIFHPDLNLPRITTDYLKRVENLLAKAEKQSDPLFFNKKDLQIDNALLNKEYNIELYYENVTFKSLQIDSVNVSCDCLYVISYDRSLNPMEQGKLILKYKPTKIGFDRKEIKFVIKDQKEMLIYFQAYVID